MLIKIETIQNGWTVEDEHGNVQAFLDIQILFEHLLLVIDGKSENFGGSMYGKVMIQTKP